MTAVFYVSVIHKSIHKIPFSNISHRGNAGSVTINLDVVENPYVTVGISLISHSIPEKQNTSDFRPP